MYITSPEPLRRLCAQAQTEGRLAIDLEFIRENTYAPQLALVQIAVSDACAIVDPLSVDDLSPLVEALTDPGILKVLHAAGQDVEVLHWHTGSLAEPIFDTQIAASMAGLGEQLSYGRLVDILLGVSLTKGESYSDWLRRNGQAGALVRRWRPGPRKLTLSSPWDLALLPDPSRTATAGGGANSEKQDYPDRGLLFIAMAGLHQIWALDLANGTIAPFAGSGREDILDGPRQEACFAQPSGLALDPAADVLYVADSETSAVRAIHLDTDRVETLVGTGLFDFGDTDAAAERVRLQHPLAVCLWPTAPNGPALLVADTYNHKIKRLDPRTREATTLLGAPGTGAHTDGVGTAARFSEPGGLALARGKLFVADTNNHALRVVDLATLDTTTIPLDETRRAHPEHT